MKKAIILILVMAFLVAGCNGGDAPGAQTQPIFPESIGSYSLEESRTEQVRCDMLEKGTKDVEGNELGVEGQVCSRGYILRYVDESTARVMFVHLIQFTEGKGVMKELMLEAYPRIYPGLIENVSGMNVYRLEKHELFWFTPSNEFGEVIIQYGSMQRMPGGTVQYSYPYTATPDNEVTLHFLGKYPPE